MFKEHLSLFNRYQFSPHLSLFPLSWWPHPRAWSEAWSWRWKGWGAHFWTEERSEDEIQLTANSFTLKRSHLSTVSSLPVAGFRLDRAAAWRQLGLRQQAELTRGQTFLTSWENCGSEKPHCRDVDQLTGKVGFRGRARHGVFWSWRSVEAAWRQLEPRHVCVFVTALKNKFREKSCLAAC